MSWGWCAPATGANTSRAKKEKATKHNRRLIDTTSSCATSFPAILRSLPTQQCPQLRRLSTVTSKTLIKSLNAQHESLHRGRSCLYSPDCREGSFSETRTALLSLTSSRHRWFLWVRERGGTERYPTILYEQKSAHLCGKTA